MQTIQVYWKGKFDGALVSINAADFNPAIHRRAAGGKWPEATPKVEKVIEPVVEAAPIAEADTEPQPAKKARKK